MFFQDRQQAAELLTEKLQRYREENPLVLAIPRGAVPMGRVLADALKGELDVVLVHKLRAPGQPELAIGAVDESGKVYIHPYARELGISDVYLAREKEEQIRNLQERRRLYTPERPRRNPEGRTVIIVDDGIATGSTMLAALQAIRAFKPAHLIVATAVAPSDTVQRLEKFADAVVCLDTPVDFYAVGQFYEDFSQVSDEEVIKILRSEGPQ